MTLYEKIKKDRDGARKAGDAYLVGILQLVLGEVETKVKRTEGAVPDDATVSAVLKKMVKSNVESIRLKDSNKLRAENLILQGYLPVLRLIDGNEIRAAMDAGHITIGDLAKHFDHLYGYRYQKGEMVKLAKDIIAYNEF